MVYGKEECLNVFVQQKYISTECVEKVPYALFLSGINF